MKKADWNRARLEALYQFDLSVALAAGRNGFPIAGCDEAGRGALAGPACVACVSIDLTNEETVNSLIGVDDSKRLTPKKRAVLFEKIEKASAVGIGWAPPAEIDKIGIISALCNATRRAYNALGVDANLVLLDRGLSLLSDLTIEQSAVSIPRSLNPPIIQSVNSPISQSFTRGDSRSLHIAAASIIAKVMRDRLMEQLDRLVPGYGFAHHKGYGTASHRVAINGLGRSPIHRESFKMKER